MHVECVDKLLDLGYKGENLYLEKDMGDSKDYIDIAIYDANNPTKIFAIIECKKWGKEFQKALYKAQKDGTQILRYAIQDKHCSSVTIYTSSLGEKSTINYIEKSIDLSLYTADNREELFEIWDKNFVDLRFFSTRAADAYKESGHAIRKKDLIPISVNDIGSLSQKNSIYNEFSEILRRHSVSDTDNAYNKIFNLFLCKIVDEDDKLADEYMDFQWRAGENADTVLLRLSDLYKKGMKTKLNLTITDYTEKDLEKAIQREIPNELKKIFIELRLYKNSEFAFKEVFDKRTFYENAAIIKEVVRLLERKQIKYSTKQQFLGDFFEKLLNMGVKQRVGQFFTPIPIAEFVLRCLPVEKIIGRKIAEKKDLFLPYTIDYSCGSGHFLTEAMERIQNCIRKIDADSLSNAQKSNLRNWNDLAWAKEFIYGVEDDYRLAKTTKVACSLNGDGEANIIYANGLDPFSSPNYWGKLHSDSDQNNRFDVVVANPPYSVPDFKERIKNGRQYFTLYDDCGDGNIESLFVERTGQLLSDEGVAGIILPSSFLIGEHYAEVRRYLLQTFQIKAICLLGQQTFSATDKSTCILFLKKVAGKEASDINRRIKNFINEKIDFPYKGSPEIISEYLASKHELSFEEYCKRLEDSSFAEYEKVNIFIWMLNYRKEIPVIKSGDKEKELLFLGYKHTSKKKYEGIIPYPTGKSRIESLLFSDNTTDLRADRLILNSFLDDDKLQIPEKYREHFEYRSVNDSIAYENGLYLIITKYFKKIDSDLNLIALSDERISLEPPTSGNSAPKGIDLNTSGDGIPFVRAEHLNKTDSNYYVIPQEYISADKALKYNLKLFRKGSVIFPKSGQSVNTNNIAMLSEDSYVVSHLAVLTFKDETVGKYVFYLLKYYRTSNFKLDDTADYPTIKLSTVKKFKIPYDRAVARKVVDEMDAIDRDSSKRNIELTEQSILQRHVYR